MIKEDSNLNIHLFNFENSLSNTQKKSSGEVMDINEKYDKGYSRVVTENGSYKVALIPQIFAKSNYNIHPDYQRRITWDSKKRSKLIESLIINIPIPPIFLYEYDFDKYEIMDGLQRITAIIDFYNDNYRLTGLEEWSELNGKKYSQLPEKIKEGIGRRQIQVVTLLKESASTADRADRIKRLLFERLNSGGVKLLPQEIRNAIYNGNGNKMCIFLSEDEHFKEMWNIPICSSPTENIDAEINEDIYELMTFPADSKEKQRLARNTLYKRMGDVELVLRFFAMRYINSFSDNLAEFLDNTLKILNSYSDDNLKLLSDLFKSTIEKAYTLFGDKAFKLYDSDSNRWSAPSKMIYDSLMLALQNYDIPSGINQEDTILQLQALYNNPDIATSLFDGKHQSKVDIIERAEFFKSFLDGLEK